MQENIQDAINDSNNTLKVNPLEYPSVTCSCGSETFVPGVVFKRIPGLVLGRGTEEQLCPITVYVCSKCGELMPEYKKKEGESKPSSGIII